MFFGAPLIFLTQKHSCSSILCKYQHKVTLADAVEIASTAEIVVDLDLKL